MEKYYTPDISEFYIGFECEIFKPKYPSSEEGNWVKTVIEPDNYMYGRDGEYDYDNILEFPRYTKVRVLYLDKEDIESLNWNPVYPVNVDTKTYLVTDWVKGLYHIVKQYPYNTSNNYTIVCGTPDTHTTKFDGAIKNKSELKKLLTQLGI